MKLAQESEFPTAGVEKSLLILVATPSCPPSLRPCQSNASEINSILNKLQTLLFTLAKSLTKINY